MRILDEQYVSHDRVYQQGDIRPTIEALDILSNQSHIYGTILTPGGKKGVKHPCAVLLHGYPGHTSTFDIAQALRRAGVVAVSLFYRGCWGSEGMYTLSGLIDDAVAAATWMRNEKTAEQYAVDRNAIFFIGHSMGGFAAINATRRLSWIRGTALLAPYDFSALMQQGHDEAVKELLASGANVLRVQRVDDLYDDAKQCYNAGYGFTHAYDDLKDRNVYFIGAARDDIAPVQVMIEPLWEQLKRHHSPAVQQYDVLDADHGFDEARLTVSAGLVRWMQKVLTHVV